MPTRFYRHTDDNGQQVYTSVETTHNDPQPPPAGAVEISQATYDQAMAAIERASDRAERDADAAVQRAETAKQQAQHQVAQRLAELGVPATALGILIPGLELPDTDIGSGEGE